MTVTQFCSWDDVAVRLSSEGAKLRTDDNTDAAQQDILNDAATEVLGYVGRGYKLIALQNSQWVRYRTRDVAVFLAATRRGNPANKSIADRYAKAIEQLELVRKGSIKIPDAAESKGSAPAMSNLKVQQFPVTIVKVVEGTSTGKAENYLQHTDNYDLLDYSI